MPRLDGCVDVGRLGQQHMPLGVPGGRVVDRSGPVGRAGVLGSADAVPDGFELDGAHGVLAGS
jgi:hypothetical protein